MNEAKELGCDLRFIDLIKKIGFYDYWKSTTWPEVFPAIGFRN